MSLALRLRCGSFLFTHARPFFFSSPLSSCLTGRGEFKNNWASGLNLNPAISAVPPPCLALRLSPSVSAFSGHVDLCLCSFITPLIHNIAASHRHQKLRVTSVKDWTFFQKLKVERVSFTSSLKRNSVPELFGLFVVVQLPVSCRPPCYLCQTITAAFIHLPQEAGQLRPAVSLQLETVEVKNKNRPHWSLNLDRLIHIHMKRRKCSALSIALMFW